MTSTVICGTVPLAGILIICGASVQFDPIDVTCGVKEFEIMLPLQNGIVDVKILAHVLAVPAPDCVEE